MGLFDRFRRRVPGGPAAVSARLEGAMARRRLRGWNPPLENINSLVASGGPRLLARSRELVVTNGYAANACEAFASNMIGDGIKPSSLITDAALRDSVQQLWLAWTDDADADGLTDFYGLQAMVAREMFVAGECFVRLRPRRSEDGLLVPLQLQLLQSEMLPFEKTETSGNGNRIRCGIEFDGIGRRVAYHFRRRHPGDSTDQGVVIPETVRVPAEDVLHIYRPIDAGQIRGLPHVAPAMVRLFLLDQYDDAELDRKKTAAMFAGFITKTAPEDPMMGESEADLDGTAIASLEPGTMQVLLPGEDVKFSSPADVGGGYEAFQYRTLLSVSASLGLPYHLVTGDVRQANYSSLRAELVEFRRRIGQLQHGVMAHQLCRPIWRRWLETAVLSGALDIGNPAVARPVQWIPPRWDWVDPLKDIQAQVLAMEAGITSRRKVGQIENRFEGAATAATTAAQSAFDRAFENNPLTAPDLGLTQAANTALATANTYRGAAQDLAEGARAPLASWQALRDAVQGSNEGGADALTEATDAAGRLETTLGDAGRAATGAGAAAGAAIAAAEPNTEAAVTGWQAVTAALSDYASKARDIGGDIGQALVGAFQSAENAVATFVKTGKLDFRDLVTSLLADLAKLAARRFILGPIANALSGALGGAGGIFANILHAGGMVGATGPSRMVPAMAFAAAPRMHSGGVAGLRHDEVPAILQRGERVLSRREAQSHGGGGVNVTIMARDAENFRQSRTQVAADIARAVSLGRRGM